MKLLILAIMASLSACAGAPPINLCKHATIRRQVFATTIAATDAYAASGRPVPGAVALGREAAATALALLDRECPGTARPERSQH